MSQTRTLHSIIDPFIKRAGGEIVQDLIPRSASLPENADFLFRSAELIVELKALEESTFTDETRGKLNRLYQRWAKEGRMIVFGRTIVPSDQLSPSCQRELFSLLARPIQENVVKKANSQIKSTRELLNFPDARGVLWITSDGSDLAPDSTWYLINQIFRKTKNGAPAYSGIDAVIYSNPRMPIKIPGQGRLGFFWAPLIRDQNNTSLKSWTDWLGFQWGEYVKWAQGIQLEEATGNLEGTAFLGSDNQPIDLAGEEPEDR